MPQSAPHRRGGRVVERAGFENQYGLMVHREFESPPLRFVHQTRSRVLKLASARLSLQA